jgi:acetyl-CoA carboxylase carboxyltransferase component
MSISDSNSSYVSRLFDEFRRLASLGLDEQRSETIAMRHARGNRSARENLDDLCDAGSFVEYGRFAVAAQRQRRDIDDLRTNTPADGVISGIGAVNAESIGSTNARTAIIINDYTVLAGAQGYFHHKKIDRVVDLAAKDRLPVIMYTEGGGGRPGDTHITTQIAALNLPTFARWAGFSLEVPRIAVNNGFCFAGNAVLFGCADIRIATKNSWIGMAGPAMIEGGGLGQYVPTDIGPTELHLAQGVVDICAEDEADATRIAKKVLSYFQGPVRSTGHADQAALRDALPHDRRFSYKIRGLIEILADIDSFTELTADYGASVITGFLRIEGVPIALLANDCSVLGGAIDASASKKAARFITMCNAFNMPILSLVDTPGFMVGPKSESEGAVLYTSDMFVAAGSLPVPVVAVCIRKSYGLGSMAMVGGGFNEPAISVAWPTGEFGPMGLEGAVKLGFRKELDAEADENKREALFEGLVAEMYEKGKATEVASLLEIDAVIDPADTRDTICKTLGIHCQNEKRN